MLCNRQHTKEIVTQSSTHTMLQKERRNVVYFRESNFEDELYRLTTAKMERLALKLLMTNNLQNRQEEGHKKDRDNCNRLDTEVKNCDKPK